jgi:hypothetical protein
MRHCASLRHHALSVQVEVFSCRACGAARCRLFGADESSDAFDRILKEMMRNGDSAKNE